MENQQKFLGFTLGSNDKAVISLQHITEVLQVSLADICGVPQMPSCVLGIYNWRGEMLWLVDLEEMLGYPSLLQGVNFLSKMMAVILEIDGKNLGFLVKNLMDIEWLDTEQMKLPAADFLSPKVSAFIQGYFINTLEEMVFNLDAAAIIKSPMWMSQH
ncbi:purine-binding chemotaxis protein CheW [Nostoc sp. FACHB-87]|uniref:chemotaxis protein CheW n=1 Tax=Nostocales TaxID=1161 RepID=UPI0016845C2C|nr:MULTISPECIES: chemotaxis protein CheW [Nostocales]MBD2299123.1 purine-binding chemotaxis protein CheW [Nostoc sp. FACHB-190]MBD2456811.1 purine-binding chemotaxis protein CheW [Nostoc sp. FACHB-87]MBD2476420.1 purine-binding chemotaxis protein CheW [Anabaena sp. FACHB-83]MBD2488363.1 purine-binding chemotaxis protein CheW [Aulosira sp. FACHB-615]